MLELNSNVSYLLGVYFGDGWLASPWYGYKYGKFLLDVTDRDFAEYVVKVWQDLGVPYSNAKCGRWVGVSQCYVNMTIYPARCSRKEHFHVNVRSNEICKYMWLIAGGRKVVPNEIMNGTNEIKKRFLEGLMDSEGSVSNSGLQFRVSSVWIRDIHNLFISLGIRVSSSIKIQRMRSSINGYVYPNHMQYYFQINSKDFASLMRFHIDRKQERLLEMVKSNNQKL